jgi:hypothetical protein
LFFRFAFVIFFRFGLFLEQHFKPTVIIRCKIYKITCALKSKLATQQYFFLSTSYCPLVSSPTKTAQSFSSSFSGSILLVENTQLQYVFTFFFDFPKEPKLALSALKVAHSLLQFDCCWVN